MGFFTAWILQKFLIYLLDNGVFMALTQLHSGIFIIKCPSSGSTQISKISNIRMLGRLSSTVNTAAGTGHDLNKIIVLFSRFYLIQHLRCVINTTNTADPHRFSGKLILCLLDCTISPTDIVKHQISKRLASQSFGSSA